LEYQICSPCGIPVYVPFSDFTVCISLHDFESSDKFHMDNVQYCQIHFFLIAFFVWELSNEEDIFSLQTDQEKSMISDDQWQSLNHKGSPECKRSMPGPSKATKRAS